MAIREFNPQFLKVPSNPRYDDVDKLETQFKKIELEIGAGAGLHPILNAKEFSETLTVGVERTAEKFKLFSGRVANHQLPNLIAIHADVVPWLWHLDPETSFDKIWILYPNPEQGNRNQRWIHAPFMSHLLKRLKPQGTIEMATNIEDYAKEVLEYGPKNWNLNVDCQKYEGPGRTHFERKYLARGENCYSLILKK